MKIQAGDHIRVFRSFGRYYHHGIAVSCDRVIHYTKRNGSCIDGVIRETSLEEFRDGGDIELVRHVFGKCFPNEWVVKRARSKLNSAEYSLLWNNCEHFATWCKIGLEDSVQVKEFSLCSGSSVIAGVSAGALVAKIASAPAILLGSKTLGSWAVGAG